MNKRVQENPVMARGLIIFCGFMISLLFVQSCTNQLVKQNYSKCRTYLLEHFECLDENGDGQITKEELENACRQAELAQDYLVTMGHQEREIRVGDEFEPEFTISKKDLK